MDIYKLFLVYFTFLPVGTINFSLSPKKHLIFIVLIFSGAPKSLICIRNICKNSFLKNRNIVFIKNSAHTQFFIKSAMFFMCKCQNIISAPAPI